MGKCAECIHYPWDVSIDPDQLLVFKKCHKDSGPRRWTESSRDAENTCSLFEAIKTDEAPKTDEPPKVKKTGKGKKAENTSPVEPVNEGAPDAGNE